MHHAARLVRNEGDDGGIRGALAGAFYLAAREAQIESHESAYCARLCARAALWAELRLSCVSSQSSALPHGAATDMSASETGLVGGLASLG